MAKKKKGGYVIERKEVAYTAEILGMVGIFIGIMFGIGTVLIMLDFCDDSFFMFPELVEINPFIRLGCLLMLWWFYFVAMYYCWDIKDERWVKVDKADAYDYEFRIVRR